MEYTNKEDLRPSMPFYVKDWLACPELRRCSYAARGLWTDILCEMWMANPRGTFITDDNRAITDLYQKDNSEYNRLITELENKKVFSRFPDGTIYCRRMYREAQELRKIEEAKSKAGKVGMAKRWHNRPITDGITKDNSRARPSVSASASASKDVASGILPSAPKSGDSAATLLSENEKEQRFKARFHRELEDWVIRKTRVHPEQRDLPKEHAVLDSLIARHGLYSVYHEFEMKATFDVHSLGEFFEAVKKLPDLVKNEGAK